MSCDILIKTTEVLSQLLLSIQNAVVYKSSLNYLKSNVESFVNAIQSLKNKDITQMESQALQKFNNTANHFLTMIPHFGQKWINAVLNWPVHHVFNSIKNFMKRMIQVCNQLSIAESILKYDTLKFFAKGVTDMQYIQLALNSIRDSAISCRNSVDIQQLISLRLNSINNFFTENKVPHLKELNLNKAIPINEVKHRMDKELATFNSLNIPLDDLKVTNKIGAGGFGTVFMATRLSTGELLAVKEVRSDKLSMSVWASLYSEVATMVPLKHPFVLELVGVHIKEPYRIITRFCSGKSLFDRLHKSYGEHLSSFQLTKIAYQVAEGMAFLHSKGIVHRDLKSMNILLDENNDAKIADFGLAGILQHNKELVGGVGTPNYSAPEILERKRYGPKIDVYSYGVILWEMAMQQIPFRDKTFNAIYDQVVNKNWRLAFTRPIPENLKSLITKCWSANPNDRPDFSEIVDLFQKGKINFESSSPLSEEEKKNILEYNLSVPFDYEYINSVLNDPSSDKYASLVQYIIKILNCSNTNSNKDIQFDNSKANSLREKIRSMNPFDNKSFSNCLNSDSVLLLASSILNPDEFSPFIRNKGILIIQNIISFLPVNSLSAIADFFVKTPKENFKLISDYIQILIDHITITEVGQHVIRFLSRLKPSSLQKYQMQILLYFNNEGIQAIEEQQDIDALAAILPVIKDNLSHDHIDALLDIFKNNVKIPISIINFLSDKISNDQKGHLIICLFRASNYIDVSERLLDLLQSLTKEEIVQISTNYEELFIVLIPLLRSRKIVKEILFIIFQIAQLNVVNYKFIHQRIDKEDIDDISGYKVLSNEDILNELIKCEGFIGMRLQIFSCLYCNENFCCQFLENHITEGILKILVDALSQKTPQLISASLQFIVALSQHFTGCNLLNEYDILQLFSQLFLSSRTANSSLSLHILINITSSNIPIPQASLIISCLMQDVLYSSSNTSLILLSLYHIIYVSSSAVQEKDLQNSILPLITPNMEPAIIVLALKIFTACESSILKNIYVQLVRQIIAILLVPSLLYPEILVTAINVFSILSLQYDINPYIEETQLIDFIDYLISSLTDDFNLIIGHLKNFRYTLTTLSVQPSANEKKIEGIST